MLHPEIPLIVLNDVRRCIVHIYYYCMLHFFRYDVWENNVPSVFPLLPSPFYYTVTSLSLVVGFFLILVLSSRSRPQQEAQQATATGESLQQQAAQPRRWPLLLATNMVAYIKSLTPRWVVQLLGLFTNKDENESDSTQAGAYSSYGDDEEQNEAIRYENHIASIRMKRIQMAAEWIARSDNILVVSGAGVSVSAGLPDFRTPGIGLFTGACGTKQFKLPYPEAVFELSYFRKHPQPFVTLASHLWPQHKHKHSGSEDLTDDDEEEDDDFLGNGGTHHHHHHHHPPTIIVPTLTHTFVTMLASKGKLLRNYTQNIDGLELMAGLSHDKLVECHGHFRQAYCIQCKLMETNLERVKNWILHRRQVPHCKRCCHDRNYIKPSITFYGEDLPDRFHDLVDDDCDQADLCLVLGTSLKVSPVKEIPTKWLLQSDKCKRILINREHVGNIGTPIPPLPHEQNGERQHRRSRRKNRGRKHMKNDDHYVYYSVSNDWDEFEADNNSNSEEHHHHHHDDEKQQQQLVLNDLFCQGDCDDTVLGIAKLLGWEDELKETHLQVTASAAQLQRQHNQ